jgi:hypothetical protein
MGMLACGLVLGMSVPARAGLVLSNAFSGNAAALQINYKSSQSRATHVGDDLFGVATMTTIQDLANKGQVVWAQGIQLPGQGIKQGQLTAVFDHFTVTSVTASPTGGFDLKMSGGTFDFYYNNNVTWNGRGQLGPSGTDATVNNGNHYTDGTLLFTAKGIPGVIPGDGSDTLFAHVTNLSNTSSGYEFYDLQVISSLTSYFPVGTVFHGESAIQGSVQPGVAAPEPASIMLVGVAVVAMLSRGYFLRRRRAFRAA